MEFGELGKACVEVGPAKGRRLEACTSVEGAAALARSSLGWLKRIPRIARSQRPRSFGVYLFILVVVTGLPILAFVGVLLAELRGDIRANAQTQANATAIARAGFITHQISDMSVTLKVIASSQLLAANNLPAFHDRIKPALAGSSWHLLLVTADGTQLLNSRVKFGSPLGKTADVPSLKAALQARTPLVSNVFFGTVSGQWVFNVVYPLPPGLPGAALILTQNISDIDARSDNQPLPPGWYSILLDGEGKIVAASDASAALGTTARHLPQPGNDLVLGVAQVNGTQDWRMMVWGDPEIAAPLLRWTWWSVFGTGLLLICVSVICALFVAHSIRRSVLALAEMAADMGEGRTVSVPNLAFTQAQEIAAAIQDAARRRYEAETRLSLALGELAHRLKNLVMVIQAIVHQTGRRTVDTTEFRRRLDNRILGLARSIDLLTRHAADAVPLRALVDAQLEAFVGEDSGFVAQGEPIAIREDAVQGVGMILHELATNAAKYGALARANAELTIAWRRLPDTDLLQLEWREQSFESKSANKGFGTTLIESTARSLGGSTTLISEAGFRTWRLILNVISDVPA